MERLGLTVSGPGTLANLAYFLEKKCNQISSVVGCLGSNFFKMSFVITDTSTVFTSPTTVPYLAVGSNPTAVVATTTAVQVAGTSQSYTTVAATPTQTVQLVVSGLNTRVNVASGAAKIAAVGGGAIVESAIAATVSTGARTIELGDSTVAYNDGVVATAAVVSGNGSGTQTIAQAAGNIAPTGGFAYYGAGGSGNDQIEGSSLNDFIRGGAGNDTINGYGGNDLIRGGAGSDSIFGGATGADTLYYTSDQLDGSTDTFVDFATGIDKIAVAGSSVASTAAISGLGSNTITFTASGTKVISGGTAINAADINIL